MKNNPLFSSITKRGFAIISILLFSAVVSADCAESCKEKYDECMRVSHVVGKEKICGEILHDCKIQCATDGE